MNLTSSTQGSFATHESWKVLFNSHSLFHFLFLITLSNPKPSCSIRFTTHIIVRRHKNYIFKIMCITINITSRSLLGLGVKVGLTSNFMKGIHIFPFSIVGSFFFFFLPSKLDVQCMVIAKKEQNKILFQIPFKLMFNKYNKQCKVCEGHLNSYFYKKSKFYKVCNDFKNNVCFNIVVGFGN